MSSSDLKSYMNESLEFLDNNNIRYGLYAFIVFYIIFVIPQLTPDVSHIFNNSMLQIFFLFLIIYISFKDIYLGILLLIALLMSLHADVKNMILFSIPKPVPKNPEIANKILIEPKKNGDAIVEITDVRQPTQQLQQFSQQFQQQFQQQEFEPMSYNDSGYRDFAMAGF